MSGLKLTRGQRLMGKIGAAAVIATLSGVPSEVVHFVAGDHDTSSMALAGKPPKPPPPPPPATGPGPLPAQLNADPNVRWFADWTVNSHPAPSPFFPTPSTINGIVPIMPTLHQSADLNMPLGIKVQTPLSGPDATTLFNTQYGATTPKKAISYVFGDLEQGTDAQVLGDVTTLVGQVRGSSFSSNAYVGQFNLTPLDRAQERMGRNPPPDIRGTALRKWGKPQYDSSGVNMANSVAYPGSGDFRNKATADFANKNIRTGLFLAPIGRVTQVQQILDTSYNGTSSSVGRSFHKQIPWVSRFNNAANSALNNAVYPGSPYAFQPGLPLNNGFVNLSGAETANQMLGRGDFSAQILHYRMRGAYSVNLFEPGVVGYTQQQMQDDVKAGWYNHSWGNRTNNIFNQPDNKKAGTNMNPQVDGVVDSGGKRAEMTGTIWSGQYSLTLQNSASTGNGGKGALDILASNLDTIDHLVKFGNVDVYRVFISKNNQGFTFEDGTEVGRARNALIEAGTHRLLQFDLVKTRVYNTEADMMSGNKKYSTQTIWLLSNSYNVFGNNDRNQMGIPEPTTFGSLAAAGAIAVVCRRQRRKV